MNEEKALAVRLQSLPDIARLAVSASPMSAMPVYRFREGSKNYYLVQAVYKDYYKLYGLPIIYYYVQEEGEERAKYILIKVDESGERVELSDRTRPGWIAVPIINLQEKPPFFP
ncbi:MAG: hypothetical protein NZ902_02685 [Acidilobaceae archaeon]|nr:hypothetical protein [Acidilobaceae archaeon]MCX8165726.1 hypothetical protein [Acidilobaceae archaeon]MDW7974151.1 cren protein [Sulfolobales archaeon]